MVEEKDKCEMTSEKLKRDATGLILESEFLKVKGDTLKEVVKEFDKKWSDKK